MKTIAVRDGIHVAADSSILYQAFELRVEYMDIHLTKEEMIELSNAARDIVEWYDNEAIQPRSGHDIDQRVEKPRARIDYPEGSVTT